MNMTKITIFGAGKVGSTVMQLAAYKNLGDIVIFNRTLDKAKGLALDLAESAPVEGFDGTVTATNMYGDTDNSDVVIITAGIPRKEGMSREELLNTNAAIVKDIVEQSVQHSRRAFYIVVTNPLDAMAYVAYKTGNLKRTKIVGMAGTLDSSRFAYFISRELDVSPSKVKALVLGSHGDTMVPAVSCTTVNGKPLSKLLSPEKIAALAERTRNAGAEIISLAKDSAFYSTASSVIQLVEPRGTGKKKKHPRPIYLDGEYAINGAFVGVPAMLGRNGVEKIVQAPLNWDEQKDLKKCGEAVKELMKQTGL